MEEGVGFGEIALIYNDKRTATIIADGDCQTYQLDGALFKSIIVQTSIEKRKKLVSILDDIKLFGKCTLQL